jgi:hypothetical protein
MFRHLKLLNSPFKGSRGRNRWFTADTLDIFDGGDHVCLDVRSKRRGSTPPIVLRLSFLDTEALGSELLKIALTRADVLHRHEAIRALRSILAKLEGEDTGEFRELIRDRDDPVAHGVTGLDR